MKRIDARRRKARPRRETFPILREPSTSFQPGKGPLDDPSFGENDKALDVIAAFHDLDVHLAQHFADGSLKRWSLIAAIGIKLEKKRKGAEQCRHQQGAAVAVLYIGGVDERMHQKALRIDEDMALLAVDFLARVIAGGINFSPFFSAFNALAVYNRSCRAGVALLPFAAGDVKRLMDTHERAVPIPQVKIIVDCGARRQLLRDRPPLAAGDSPRKAAR